MLSLSRFRANLFPLFKIMRDAGEVFEVFHNGKVYQVHVVFIEGKKPVLRHPRKLRSKELDVEAERCVECGSLRFNGVCMKKSCPTNRGRSRQ
jgi:hypothetical protein